MSSVQASETEILIQPRPGWIAINWTELWESRELLFYMVWRDVTVRYKQTVLGVLWAVLQPVFSMLIFTIIFGHLAQLPSDGIPYPIFVYAGLLPWNFAAGALGGASGSLLNQQALLTKIYLPRLYVPASVVGGGLVDLAVSFGVFAVLMVIYQVPVGVGVFALPFLILIAMMASTGLGLVLAAVTVTYRDFRYVVPFLVQAGLYLSPVIYPVSLVPEKWRWVLALNPMTGVIDGFRASLLGKPWNLEALAIAVVVSTVLMVYGLFYFRKMERRFADIA